MPDRLDELHDLYWPGLERPIGYVRTGPQPRDFSASIDLVSVRAQGANADAVVDAVQRHVHATAQQFGMIAVSIMGAATTNVFIGRLNGS